MANASAGSPSAKLSAAKAPEDPSQVPQSRSWLSWLVGWVVVPGLVVGSIVGAGVVLGAHRPDSWIARAVMWIAARVG